MARAKDNSATHDFTANNIFTNSLQPLGFIGILSLGEGEFGSEHSSLLPVTLLTPGEKKQHMLSLSDARVVRLEVVEVGVS